MVLLGQTTQVLTGVVHAVGAGVVGVLTQAVRLVVGPLADPLVVAEQVVTLLTARTSKQQHTIVIMMVIIKIIIITVL